MNTPYYIGSFCSRWGRIAVSDTKWKFDEVRVYASFGLYNLHSLIWPGYNYTQWNRFGIFGKIAQFLDDHIFYKILPLLNPIVIPYQKFIYRLAYKRAFKKFPDSRRAMKSGADYYDLIKDLCTKDS